MNMDKIKNSFDHIALYAKNLHFKTCVMVKHFRPGYTSEYDRHRKNTKDKSKPTYTIVIQGKII